MGQHILSAGNEKTNTMVLKVLVAQLNPTLVTPWTVAPTSSSVHGILQASILEWAVILFSRGSSQPETEPRSPTLQAYSLPSEPAGT